MSAEEVLRESDEAALDNNQIVSNVTGKSVSTKVKGKGKLNGFSATGIITLIIIVFAVLLNSGTLIPSALSERLLEETDMQYADAVESKKLVFQQALASGKLPDNTIAVLKEHGVLVGQATDNGFVEGNNVDGQLMLKMDNKIITAKEFVDEVSSDTRLYDAFNSATYSRTAYYYDEAGESVFKQIGTTRHNYTDESDFNEVMKERMGEGSNIDINGISETKNEDGDSEYDGDNISINSKTDALELVQGVSERLPASSGEESALNTADALKAAETDVRNKRSSLFYSLIMETISQMKAEEGNNTLNQMMNYLTDVRQTEVVDVDTGEIIKVTGSALDSPSLFAILSGNKPDNEKIKNYSSDRILKTVENQFNTDGKDAILGTVASSSKSKEPSGSIGRLILSKIQTASSAIVNMITPSVSKSLVKNSYEDIQGVDAGEFLAEGAVNTGRMLAQASGGTAGDADAVTKYAKLNSAVIAMDAEVDRVNRSPFDITSKNTFLGSILYKFAISSRFNRDSLILKSSSIVGEGLKSFASIVAPEAYADDGQGYLTNFGECETIGLFGAVGTASCSQIATFDTSTLDNPFGDEGFIRFVEDNTSLSGGIRSINEGSVLSEFVLFNNERITPFGILDGGILDAIGSGGGSIPVLSNIVSMIESFIGASDSDKAIATGAAFVNSAENGEWDKYKYAQRYVSLARATAALRQYSDNSTAYNSIPFFEGGENPVIAYLNQHYNIASR